MLYLIYCHTYVKDFKYLHLGLCSQITNQAGELLQLEQDVHALKGNFTANGQTAKQYVDAIKQDMSNKMTALNTTLNSATSDIMTLMGQSARLSQLCG